MKNKIIKQRYIKIWKVIRFFEEIVWLVCMDIWSWPVDGRAKPLQKMGA